MQRNFLGIDPGANGGMALLSDSGYVLFASKFPETHRDLWDVLDCWVREYADSRKWHCLIEKVASSPQMGVVSAFTFGKNYGVLLGLLTASGIPFEYVYPSKWQKHFGCQSGRKNFKGGDKNVTKRKAQELFPGEKITHAVADALLIAEYARRTCK